MYSYYVSPSPHIVLSLVIMSDSNEGDSKEGRGKKRKRKKKEDDGMAELDELLGAEDKKDKKERKEKNKKKKKKKSKDPDSPPAHPQDDQEGDGTMEVSLWRLRTHGANLCSDGWTNTPSNRGGSFEIKC